MGDDEEMKTAILSVGTELLFGQIVNTNTVFLSQQMNMLDLMSCITIRWEIILTEWKKP